MELACIQAWTATFLLLCFLLSCFRYSDDVEPQKMLCLGKRNPKRNGFCAVGLDDGWPRLMNVLTSLHCFSVAFVIFDNIILQNRGKCFYFFTNVLQMMQINAKLWSNFFCLFLKRFFFCFCTDTCWCKVAWVTHTKTIWYLDE